ncbi:MAG: mechanosensitive ion channel family protein, partial [Bacilli bacterium]|nr:mechanosensitive ion channel family protein [Bacilli bacterium]
IYIIFSNLLFSKIEKKNYKIFRGNKSNTYLKLFKSISRYIFIIIMIFILLKINGVNITSMVTGVGVIGIIFGFTIQDALKDIIKGFDIITDSYYQVGDIVRIDKYTGKVLAIGIKTTKLEDIYEKNIISISNRNIEKVEIVSHMINIDIPLPYELKLEEAEKAIEKIIDKIKEIKTVEKVEYRGVNEFGDSCINYQIKVYSNPIDKVQTRRDSLTCILRNLEKMNITIPYQQIDIHQK